MKGIIKAFLYVFAAVLGIYAAKFLFALVLMVFFRLRM